VWPRGTALLLLDMKTDVIEKQVNVKVFWNTPVCLLANRYIRFGFDPCLQLQGVRTPRIGDYSNPGGEDRGPLQNVGKRLPVECVIFQET